MADALLGHTGFVGTTLLRQRAFGACFNSSNIESLADADYDLVVCAAAPAQKWLVNRDPEADRQNMARLQRALERLRCRHFVLISTVDVFGSPRGVDESSPVTTQGLHPYGLHRHALEQFVASRFRRSSIVRLPGLVGPGLRKNVIHDLHHRHELHKIDRRGRFQFYPMVNLWSDLQRVLAADLRLVHLDAESVTVSEIASEVFGIDLAPVAHDALAVSYDVRSVHVAALGGRGDHLYDRREVLAAVRGYAQSEPRRGG